MFRSASLLLIIGFISPIKVESRPVFAEMYQRNPNAKEVFGRVDDVGPASGTTLKIIFGTRYPVGYDCRVIDDGGGWSCPGGSNKYPRMVKVRDHWAAGTKCANTLEVDGEFYLDGVFPPTGEGMFYCPEDFVLDKLEAKNKKEAAKKAEELKRKKEEVEKEAAACIKMTIKNLKAEKRPFEKKSVENYCNCFMEEVIINSKEPNSSTANYCSQKAIKR